MKPSSSLPAQNRQTQNRSIHPQGWVPIETATNKYRVSDNPSVAFTPKGGCPLKLVDVSQHLVRRLEERSIHPQGWVPIETPATGERRANSRGSIHPQGWVPIETSRVLPDIEASVACSIHPQGWVPIETCSDGCSTCCSSVSCSIHPQGWVPIETANRAGDPDTQVGIGSIHPQGWVPIETLIAQPCPSAFRSR